MRERPRALDGDKIQVNVVLSASLQQKLKTLRDRLSHQNASPTLAEQIELLADFALRKLKGRSTELRSYTRQEVRSANQTETQIRMSRPPQPSRYLSTHIRREVWSRAGARCEQTLSNGERCSRTHLLQIDHRFPVAWGGGNELTNLQLLCAVHNQVKSDRLPGE